MLNAQTRSCLSMDRLSQQRLVYLRRALVIMDSSNAKCMYNCGTSLVVTRGGAGYILLVRLLLRLLRTLYLSHFPCVKRITKILTTVKMTESQNCMHCLWTVVMHGCQFGHLLEYASQTAFPVHFSVPLSEFGSHHGIKDRLDIPVLEQATGINTSYQSNFIWSPWWCKIDNSFHFMKFKVGINSKQAFPACSQNITIILART